MLLCISVCFKAWPVFVDRCIAASRMAAVGSALICFATWVTCWEQHGDVERHLGLESEGLEEVQGVCGLEWRAVNEVKLLRAR